MPKTLLKQTFIIGILAVAGLLLLACSAPVPNSSSVTVAPAIEPAIDSATALDPVQVTRTQNSEASPEVNAAAAPPVQVEAAASSDVVPAVPVSPAVEPAASAGAGEGIPVGTDAGAASSDYGDKSRVGIVATGAGRATSAPDLATLNLGVEAIDATVGEARTEAAIAMTDVVDSLQANGVLSKDIQTGYFRIHPRYTGREVTRCIESESSAEESGELSGEAGDDRDKSSVSALIIEGGEQECFQEYQSVITGYEVSNELTVLVRDLDTVDDVIDAAVEAGGDAIRFNGLSFSLEETAELEAKARSAAVADLAAKAGALADLGGVTLGNLVYLTEVVSPPPGGFGAESLLAKASADFGGRVSTPIAPGEVSVEVIVQGQYLIIQP